MKYEVSPPAANGDVRDRRGELALDLVPVHLGRHDVVRRCPALAFRRLAQRRHVAGYRCCEEHDPHPPSRCFHHVVSSGTQCMIRSTRFESPLLFYRGFRSSGPTFHTLRVLSSPPLGSAGSNGTFGGPPSYIGWTPIRDTR